MWGFLEVSWFWFRHQGGNFSFLGLLERGSLWGSRTFLCKGMLHWLFSCSTSKRETAGALVVREISNLSADMEFWSLDQSSWQANQEGCHVHGCLHGGFQPPLNCGWIALCLFNLYHHIFLFLFSFSLC